MKSIVRLVTMTLVISAWVAAGLFYQELPNRMPTHWSTPLFRADAYAPKPSGVFVMPLIMAIMWLGTPVIRLLSPRRQKTERFPGAFEFNMMLSIGLLFVIWSFVIAQSVLWLLAVAVPVSIGLVIAGSVMPHEAEWFRIRPLAGPALVITGLSLLGLVAFAR